MKEVKGDIWNHTADIICITTNGVLNTRGRNVMGRGIAFEAKLKFPGLDARIVSAIRVFGNHLYMMWEDGLCTFPTKEHWRHQSSIDLIKRSAEELAIYAKRFPDKIFVLPRPGCGYGGLTWEFVKVNIKDILPDNVEVIDWDS